MKAVWQVVVNRARIDKMKICDVVRKRGSFPWTDKMKSWKISQEQLTTLFEVVSMKPVVSSRTYYFNHKRQKWGIHQRKLGNLYFSEIPSNI